MLRILRTNPSEATFEESIIQIKKKKKRLMDRGHPHNSKEKLLSKIKLKGSVHTCCPGAVGPSTVVAGH